MRSRTAPLAVTLVLLTLCLVGCGGSKASSSQPPLAIRTAILPAATVGIAYNQTMAATGGAPPFTWSVSAGNLPTGMTVSNAGVISGTPTGTPGTTQFTVTVSDVENPPAKATANLSIVVNSAATALFQGTMRFSLVAISMVTSPGPEALLLMAQGTSRAASSTRMA